MEQSPSWKKPTAVHLTKLSPRSRGLQISHYFRLLNIRISDFALFFTWRILLLVYMNISNSTNHKLIVGGFRIIKCMVHIVGNT